MDGEPACAKSLHELAARLFRGDEKVLAEVLEAVGPSVRALLAQKYRGLQSRDDIEDVLAVALFRLWRGRQLYDPTRASLHVWFYRIADNVVKDVLRSGWHRARRLEIHLPHVAEEDSPPPPGPESAAELDPECARQVKDLREVLAALPDVQRRIILADAQSRDPVASSAALAQELGLPPSTIRVYRKRALDAVRAEMKKRGHQVP